MRRFAAFRIGVSSVFPVALLGLLVLAFVFVAPGPARNTGKAPLIGANYTHYAFPSCGLNDTGIVLTYNRPSVRTIVRRQLAAMRAAGIQTLRLLLWHVTDASGMRWGIVSSGGGQLSEPYRSNLIRYMSDVRKAGFEQLTLVFAPEGNDAPLPPAPGNVYDPTKFEVNWRFIRDVRPLLKKYGPDSTHVDLINEGAPPAWESPTVITQAKTYITNMWPYRRSPARERDRTVSPLRGINLRTADGGPLTALETGRFTIAITDASRGDNFHLVGPGVNQRTGLAFTGRAKWSLRLHRGTYRYRSDRPHSKLHGSFVVLRAG